MLIRMIHPAAGVGLLINAFLVGMLTWLLSQPELLLLPADEAAVFAVIQSFLPILVGCVLAQAVALALIVNGQRVGLMLACAAGFFLCPASLIYLTGCFFSYWAVKSADFERAASDFSDAEAVFPSANTKKYSLASCPLCIFSLGMWFTGMTSLAGLFLGVGCVILYLAYNAHRNPALTLHPSHMTIVPSVLSPRLHVAYAKITKATLIEKQCILFTVETPQGLRNLRWPILTVEETRRREAFEKLTVALTKFHVPLS